MRRYLTSPLPTTTLATNPSPRPPRGVTLVNNQYGKLLEDLVKLCHGLRDLRDLLRALLHNALGVLELDELCVRETKVLDRFIVRHLRIRAYERF